MEKGNPNIHAYKFSQPFGYFHRKSLFIFGTHHLKTHRMYYVRHYLREILLDRSGFSLSLSPSLSLSLSFDFTKWTLCKLVYIFLRGVEIITHFTSKNEKNYLSDLNSCKCISNRTNFVSEFVTHASWSLNGVTIEIATIALWSRKCFFAQLASTNFISINLNHEYIIVEHTHIDCNVYILCEFASAS